MASFNKFDGSLIKICKIEIKICCSLKETFYCIRNVCMQIGKWEYVFNFSSTLKMSANHMIQ